MKSLLASVRAGGGPDRVDHAVQRLEDEWRRHGDVPLDRFWKEQRHLLRSDSDDSLIVLSELIKTDLRCRFARGQTPAVADYLERFPGLESSDSRVLSLIYEEFCLVEERGDRLDVSAFCDRYPRWRDSLVSQLQYHHLLSQAAGARPKAPPFPEAGDQFEEFQLVSLLGKGGTSRVFLARDLSLGGKQVVLKVSLDRGREPQAQGALDHPHIVPVNNVVFSDEGMRGLSMPYRPGLPLDEVIRRVAPASRPARAMAIWEALVGAPEEAGPSPKAESDPRPTPRAPRPRGDGWEGFPVRGTYAQGVAWVVKVVAEALHYAHRQRTFHRDVKPANVLLTIQHGPQLLDFNLAESPHSVSQAQAAMQGGTLPYMAPEQIEAFLDHNLWGRVGPKADLYSLGLVLREMLTGQAPDLPAETMAPARAMRVLLDRRPLLDVSVRRANPSIPHALEAIVAKCLSVGPDDRYPDAGALAEDLDRFLHRQPLLHAANTSRRERGTNWAVRNRLRLLGFLACLGPFLFLLGWVARGAMAARGPSVPIVASPAFRAAVAALDADSRGPIIEPLIPFVDVYPASTLPRLYLGLAHQARGNNMDAVVRFQEVVRMLREPGARQEVIDWAPSDPGLADRLERFALRRFDAVNRIEDPSELRRKQLADEQYELAREAAQLAHELRPDSDTDANDYILACCDLKLGDPESACRRADRAIERLATRQPSDLEQKNELGWTLIRLRATRRLAMIERAERLRAQGPEAARQARELLRDSEKDINCCTILVEQRRHNAGERLEVDEVRLKGWIAWADIDLELGRIDEARGYLNQAQRLYDGLEDSAKDTPMAWDLPSCDERIQALQRRIGRVTASRR